MWTRVYYTTAGYGDPLLDSSFRWLSMVIPPSEWWMPKGYATNHCLWFQMGWSSLKDARGVFFSCKPLPLRRMTQVCNLLMVWSAQRGLLVGGMGPWMSVGACFKAEASLKSNTLCLDVLCTLAVISTKVPKDQWECRIWPGRYSLSFEPESHFWVKVVKGFRLRFRSTPADQSGPTNCKIPASKIIENPWSRRAQALTCLCRWAGYKSRSSHRSQLISWNPQAEVAVLRANVRLERWSKGHLFQTASQM